MNTISFNQLKQLVEADLLNEHMLPKFKGKWLGKGPAPDFFDDKSDNSESTDDIDTNIEKDTSLNGINTTILMPVSKDQYPNQVLAASNIKKELNYYFPQTKFKVRSKSFSMGDAVDISWENGPTTSKVDKIIAKYEKGSFDGMEDLYTFHTSKFNEIYGGAKYVSTQRRISDDLQKKTVDLIITEFEDRQNAPKEYEIRRMASKLLNIDIPHNYNLNKLSLNTNSFDWVLEFN